MADGRSRRGTDPLIDRQARSFFLAIPVYLAVPWLWWGAYRGFGIRLDWTAAGIGVLGWWIALLLRAPLALLARRLPESQGKVLLVGASGPLEEGMRFAALALTGSAIPWALSVGWGWAAIEVLFAVVNGLMVVRLLRRDDEQAREVRELLASQGTLRASTPWWGVVERVFASALHIGLTLWIAAAPVLVLLAALVHSSANLGVTRLTGRLSMQMGIAALLGTGALVIGIALAA